MHFTHNTALTAFIEVDGIRYAYRRFGVDSGIPLLCLQHFRGGLDNWDPLVTDGLAADRTVILFNNAGVSTSTGEPSSTVSEMATHIINFLGALNISQVDILGFSMGGFAAQQVTVDRPNLVRRLVLVGTGPQGGEGMVHVPKVAQYATREVPAREDFLFLFFEPTETSQAAGKAFWERRHERREQDVPSSKEAMGAQANAIATWGIVPSTNRYADLKRIHQPVLVVNGSHDIVVPTINSYILQQNLPNATLILYPDSGHGSLFQHANLFVSQARQFLNG
jgi:pimeloyl-ACP methyl ester carboxylesterase